MQAQRTRKSRGITSRIRKLAEKGKTRAQVIKMGYNINTVYAQFWRYEKGL